MGTTLDLSPSLARSELLKADSIAVIVMALPWLGVYKEVRLWVKDKATVHEVEGLAISKELDNDSRVSRHIWI